MALQDFVAVKWIMGILQDPVYKDYYVLKAECSNGDIVVSPVMDHYSYMIYESGLRAKTMTREIAYFHILGRGSEDDMSDLRYQEIEDLKKQPDIKLIHS